MPTTPDLQIFGGRFQDMEGSPLALGYLLLELSHDEEVSTVPAQVVGGLKRRIGLDLNGDIPVSPATLVWSNASLLPSGSFYIVRAFKFDGTEAWRSPQYWTLAATPDPLDVGTIVPLNPPGGGLSGGGSTLLLQTNEVNNGSQSLLDLHAGTNITLTDNGSGRVTIDASGGANFSTPGQGYFFGFQDVMPLYDGSGTGASGAGVSNTVMFAQLNLPYTITISKIAVFVLTAAGIAASMTAAIYNAAGTTKLIDAGSFDTGTSSQVARSNTITPVTLTPGSYLFAQGATSGGSFGTVLGHGPYGSYFVNSMLNVNATRVGTAANAIAGGVMPATLGVLTPYDHTNNAVLLPAVMFQA